MNSNIVNRIFEKRTIQSFSKSIQNTAKFMSISRKINLVGSASLKSILYYHDFDLNEIFNDKIKKKKEEHYPIHILKLYRKKYHEAYENPNTYITDFKCGLDPNGEALHWKKEDIYNGYIINSLKQKVQFVDAIFQKGIMKIDVIEILEDDLLGEFSDVVLIKIGDKRNFFPFENSNEFVLNNLLKDYDSYQYVEHNYYKSLKRIFSFYLNKSKIKHKKTLVLLLDFFNSNIGKLNKVKTNLITIQMLINNNFKKPNINIIKINIKHCIFMLNELKIYDVKNELQKCLQMNSIQTINETLENVIERIYGIVNEKALEFQNSHKYILPY